LVRPYLRCEFERHKRNWAQAYLSKLTGISQGDISAIESGRWIPSANQLGKLALALGVTPPAALIEPVNIIDPDESRARTFLLSALRVGQWVFSEPITEAADEIGIDRQMLNQARRGLPIIRQDKFGEDCWCLTEQVMA
jgi:transcriptional regulator with XRE-family HTH domain